MSLLLIIAAHRVDGGQPQSQFSLRIIAAGPALFVRFEKVLNQVLVVSWGVLRLHRVNAVVATFHFVSGIFKQCACCFERFSRLLDYFNLFVRQCENTKTV